MKTDISEVHITMNGQRGGFDIVIVHSQRDGRGQIETHKHGTSIQDAIAELESFTEKFT